MAANVTRREEPQSPRHSGAGFLIPRTTEVMSRGRRLLVCDRGEGREKIPNV